MEKVYTAVVTAKGARDGHIRSSDGNLDLDLRKPKEMDGEGGTYTNPEQLFAGAYGACYLDALGSIAKRHNIDVSEATVDVHIILNKDGLDTYTLSGKLYLHIPGVSREEAQTLANKAHVICPYSKATRGNMDIKVIGD